MAVKEVLTKLLKFGVDKNYFIISEVGKLDKSCCKKSKVKAIDFDKTKEKVVNDFNLDTIKSCDALKIIPQKKCIDFIEMKSSINIINNINNNTQGKLQQQVDKFDFEGKIRDSLYILYFLVNNRNSNLMGYEKNEYYKVKKNYIILTDINIEINPLDYLAFTLDYLGQMSSSLSVMLKEAVENIPPDSYQNLQQPKLMNCESFKHFYTT